MLAKLSPQQSGTLGELLTVAKLNTLGLAAYISPEGAPGHDIVVVLGGEAKSIEVKTRQFRQRESEIQRWPVIMNTKGDADFFIFVALDIRDMSPTYYVLTNEQARQTHKEYAGSGSCLPSHVRRLANPNDFSLIAGRAPSITPHYN